MAENSNLKVEFFDVGQGDAIFIQTPENHQILVDGGPGSAVVGKLAEEMPFWDRTIDLIILTHPESDHMAGIMEVLQRYKVDYFLWTGIVRITPEYKRMAEILNQKKSKTKVKTVSAGEIVKAGNVSIDILYPFKNLAGQEFKNTSNDTCVVSRLVFGKSSFLFTGDISKAAEKELANSYALPAGRQELAGIKSDVLKVAHHGSKYSSSDLFLENVQPKIAVISVGAKNTYGHPTPETLQRLEKYDIKVLRTDKEGDITMLSDGNNIYTK